MAKDLSWEADLPSLARDPIWMCPSMQMDMYMHVSQTCVHSFQA